MKRLKAALTLFFVLILVISFKSYGQSEEEQKKLAFLQLSEDATVANTLNRYRQKANELWAEQSSKLNFATDFLSVVSRYQAENYYKPASLYYFWSLKNADFAIEKEAINAEVNRLLPLVPDSTQKQWNQYLEQENRQLFDEIIGFWKVQDPYSSTAINERLFEHWNRIQYAQATFNENNNSVYSTDERGVFYVRMGQPDRIIKKNLQLSGVTDPVSFEYLTFELGNVVNSDIEIWEYNTDQDSSFVYLFGQRNGFGEYGQRKDVLELIDTQGLRVQIPGGNFLSTLKLKKFSERVAQVGLYQQLAPLHPLFSDLYRQLENSLFVYSTYSSLFQRYLSSSFTAEPIMNMKYYRQKEQAPESDTDLKLANEQLALRTQVFRFLNSDNQNEYLFSVQSIPHEDQEIKSYESYFLSNKLFVYGEDWNLLEDIDDLKKVDERTINEASTYQISDSALAGNRLYFSSELIDTTRNNIKLPGKINSQTSAIVSSTGKKQISFPEPLPKTDSFSISDVIVGNAQEENLEARLPITPSLEYKFEKDADIMIYFEAYNVPEGGYSFTYFFKKDRWLLSNKKIERTEITILADRAKDRDSQLFSINPNDLEPGIYEVIFQFNPLDNSSDIEPVEKAVEIEITE